MRLAHLPASAKALALVLATGLVVACLAPLIGEPVEERSALWVVTDRALVRVGLDTDGTHRTTDPIPGAQAAEVRVRGNRLITARTDAITSHALTPTLEPDEGTTVAMDAAAVSGLAVSADGEHIWLARPAPRPDKAAAGNGRFGDGGHGHGRNTRITAFNQDLMPRWQKELPGPIVALAAADQDEIAVWALQPRQLIGLDEAGASVVTIDLPNGPPARAFVPLDNQRLAVADLRGIRLFDVSGQLLADQRRLGTRELHPVSGDESTGFLWAAGRHRLALLDEQLQPLQTWHLPAQGLVHPVAAGTADPRDGSLWFVVGDSLYNAESDGTLTEHRDLFAYLGTDPVTDLALYADTFAPDLNVIEPAEPLVTNNDQPDLILEYNDIGIGVDTDTLTVEQNGAPTDGTCETDTEEQRVECVIGPFDDGTHTVTATVADYAGNESEPAEATYEIDTVAPEITIESPTDGAHLNTEAVTVRGQLSETAELIIDGEAASLDVDNRFEHVVALGSDGARSIELEAIDGAGNRTKRVLTVIRDTVAPAAIVAAGLTVEAGDEPGQVRITGADGSAEPEAEVVITNTRTGDTIVVQANAQGAFTATIAGEVGDTYEIVVRDAAGNESGAEEVTGDTGGSDEVPPDPADVAPPLPETGIPPFEDQISFLYEGDHAIQKDVAPGTIEARRVSVLRGNVRNRAGDPISGVRITILNHPELGYTATQAGGDFDLAVNGGGVLTVEYKKDGYLPVQRTVSTQWNGWYHADDVVMIPLDDQVTTIDLTDDSQPFQVAQGSVVTDADGTRQATVLFPAGTTAEITLPDGTKKQLSELDVRATEYTVGDTGPAAMPGALPPASAYTYAVELSVDQALEQGVKVQGKDVVFNQPVPVYVDNFLEFPVGEPVPIGYYNNDTAAWVPHPNGRIVGILEEQGGLAVLDVTGDDNAATMEELDELNITNNERAQLATLYAPGESFWRMTTTHLSTWDHNWPHGPPDDASRPTTSLPNTVPADEPDSSDEENPCDGCVISPQKQSLGESIDIAGTAYALHYQSDRSSRTRNHTVSIPVTGGDVPDSLLAVKLEIAVAGRRETHFFSDAPHQVHRFTWDGLDAFGRERNGSELMQITLAYVYPCIYYGSDNENGFGRFGGQAQVLGTRDRCRAFELLRTTQVAIEPPFASPSSIGNWSLSAEHTLWGRGQRLLRGDGTSRSVPSGIIDTAAGTGEKGYSGDGGPATEARLRFPSGVTLDSDGSLYIADGGDDRIRRVGADGVIETVAGTGIKGYSGDGGPAMEARFDSPLGIALDSDGRLYIADGSNNRIRRIGTDGIIETVAGTGIEGYSGDGGPATEARLYHPYDVTFGFDGSLYIADWGNDRVRRVGPDGMIETVAGTGIQGYSGDGGPATEARLTSPSGVAVGSDGSLYIADLFNHRVRQVGADGIIETVAGTGVDRYSGDGGPATEAGLGWPEHIALDSDGSLYIADTWNHRIRRVGPDGVIETVAGAGWQGALGDGGLATEARLGQPYAVALGFNGSLYIADPDVHRIRRVAPGIHDGHVRDGSRRLAAAAGGRTFVFDDSGRHLRSEDAHTGDVMLTFEHDDEGRLIAIVDADSNTTVIERDATGMATAVVAPDGQRTALTVDSNGHLTSLTDPDGATWAMDYTDDGLLTRIEKPGEAINTFAYDGNGRLIEDIDSNGGGWQLSRTELEDGYRTVMTSGEGRVRRFTTERPDSFTRVYTNEAPDGTVTKRTHTDSDTIVERADGTVVTAREVPDPRFGMSAPYEAKRHIEVPSGLVFQASMDRSVTLADSADPLSLENLTDSITTNGRTRSVAYDGPTRTWTATSAMGRTATTVVDDQSRPLEQVVPGIEAVHTDYDGRGRISSIRQGSGTDERTTAFAYHRVGDQAGYLASVTDALDRTVSFETDAVGRVTKQTLPDGRNIGYQYDGRGNLVALTPPGRDAHVFQYDGLDQRLDYTPPDLSGAETVTQYTYNLDRQLREIQRPNGEIVTFDYDTGGRLATRRTPAGDTTYGYDATTGQVTSTASPGGVGLQFQWDGFLPTRTDWTGPVSGSVSRTFDNNFWLTQESVNGNSVAFDYDDDGLLTGAGNLNVARHADNGLITGTTQADVTGTRDYNAFGELADRAVTADGTTIYDVEYTRDKLGRIVEETETLSGETHTWQYDYDLVGRLVEVRRDGTPVHLYDYDANGNRTSHTGSAGTRTGTYDAQDRITSYGDATYTHTPAGEWTSKTTPQGTTEYDYDAAGNLREVTLSDGTEIEYLIDGQDRRIGKVVNGDLQKGWLYRDQLNPVAQIDADGNVTHRFVYGDKPNVPAYMINGDTAYRIVSDHLDSVRLVIDTTTNEIVQRMDYSPFGEVIADTNPGFQPFGFAGGLYDRDTGLVRFGARDYDPEIGRWTAKDPIGFAGGTTNLYGYAINDPVNFVDPNGNIVFTAIVVGAAIGATSSAAGTLIAGGSAGEAVVSGVIGAVLGGATGGTGAIATAGASGARSVLTGALRGAATGGGGNAIGQGIGIARSALDPCRQSKGFNFGAAAGATVGGALGGGLGSAAGLGVNVTRAGQQVAVSAGPAASAGALEAASLAIGTDLGE